MTGVNKVSYDTHKNFIHPYNYMIHNVITYYAGLKEFDFSKEIPPPSSEMLTQQWFVMRDLKRPNAKVLAYKYLEGIGIEVFTPLKRHYQSTIREWVEKPLIHGLLFVHGTRDNLDPVVEGIPTLQYRYQLGKRQEPMIVPDAEMERFIHAVNATDSPRYYLPEEITPKMYGSRIRVAGGPLNGYEGFLLTTRGSRTKRLLVELPGFLSVGVEVNPDYIELLK